METDIRREYIKNIESMKKYKNNEIEAFNKEHKIFKERQEYFNNKISIYEKNESERLEQQRISNNKENTKKRFEEWKYEYLEYIQCHMNLINEREIEYRRTGIFRNEDTEYYN